MSDALKDASISAEWLDYAMAENARATQAAGEAIIDYATDTGIWGDNAEIARVKALDFGAALGYDAEQAAAAAAALEAFNTAFQEVIQTGDYTTKLPGADKPLVSPERTYSVTTQISGPTAEQADLLERYGDLAERAARRVADLENGVGTYGMTQEQVTTRIEEARGELEYYQQLMGGIPPVVSEVSTAHEGMKVNVDAAKQAIFDQLSVMDGVHSDTIIAFGVAIGVMTEEQGRAALAAASVKVKIEELATKIAEGMPIETALADLDEFVKKLEDTGTAAGEGLAQGIDESHYVAVDAMKAAAEEVIDVANSTFQIESPSRVFAEIGDNLGVGLVQGFSDNIAAAQSTLQSIGESVIAGVNRGIEAGKASLREILSGVATLIPD